MGGIRPHRLDETVINESQQLDSLGKKYLKSWGNNTRDRLRPRERNGVGGRGLYGKMAGSYDAGRGERSLREKT